MSTIKYIDVDPVISMYESSELSGHVIIDFKGMGFVRFGYGGMYLSIGYRDDGKIIGVDIE